MNIDNVNIYKLFENILIYCISIYFFIIAFKIIIEKLNIKNYFLENNLEFLIKRIISIILNLVICTLAFIGLYYIAAIDLKFYSNIVAFILIILIIKLSVDFSFYFFNSKLFKSLCNLYNKKRN
jgi:uncharacterized protein YacL